VTNAISDPEIVIHGGASLSRQIRDQIHAAIISGVLLPGEPLPSVREMAVELAINPDCVQRAYAALEQEGLVSSAEGTGIFVAVKPSSDLHELCLELLLQAERRGYTSIDVVETIETLTQGRLSS
jgi:GntR family transcriptional regulator